MHSSIAYLCRVILLTGLVAFKKTASSTTTTNEIGTVAQSCNCHGQGNGPKTCQFSVTSPPGRSLTQDKTIQFSLDNGSSRFVCIRQGGNSHGPDATAFPLVVAVSPLSWSGICNGNGALEANFVLPQNTTSEIYGSINLGSQICHISPNLTQTGSSSNEHVITCQPTSDFPPEASPRQGQARRYLRSEENGHRELVETDPDIMVVWTVNAECRNANLPRGCNVTAQTQANMMGKIQLAIFETNQAYNASGVAMQLRLVAAFRDTSNYQENATNAYLAALNSITKPSDGYLDYVQAKRSAYGADMVALVIDDMSYCGIAWIGPDPGYMYSVNNWLCLTGVYGFAHETGPNMVRRLPSKGLFRQFLSGVRTNWSFLWLYKLRVAITTGGR